MANQPLPDAMLDDFAARVAGGDSPGSAYRAIYAPDRVLTRQACFLGGKLRMSYPLVVERIRQLKAQAGSLPRQALVKADVKCVKSIPLTPVTEQIKKPPQDVKPETSTIPRNMLLARLWKAVNSDTNPEAIAAVKQLRDWLREDEQDNKAQQVADPAIICKHLSALQGDFAGLDAAGKLQYSSRIVDKLIDLGMSRDNIHAASAPTLICNDLQQEPVTITQSIADNPIDKPIDSIDLQHN